MCYTKFGWTMLVFVVLFTAVSGSCLEFGHSCWGAHGKRSGNRAAIAAKQPTPYVDNLAEQLFDNNNNANSLDDDGNNNSNKNYNALAPPSGEALAAAAERNDAKLTQLLRQHQYKLRQMQRQFEANDAADSWRKLQQALAQAEQQQQQQQQKQQLQQQQQQPIGEFFELKK